MPKDARTTLGEVKRPLKREKPKRSLKSIFGGWFSRGSEQTTESASQSETRQEYENVRYMNLIETYGIEWTLEKTAREVLQNFFDPNKTLDCVSIETFERDGKRVIRIENEASYDRRLLLHLGGTTKTGGNDSGIFGEGGKMAAFVLLRDYGFSSVKYASNDWELEFFFHKLPEDEYPVPVNGLFVGEKKISRIKGNYAELVTDDPAQAEVFLAARNLFYHSQNPDFENPILDIPGVGGFNLLSSSEKKVSGNLYVAGQRRHYDKDEWNTVANINLWIWEKDMLPKDRDRGIVSFHDAKKVVEFLVENIPAEELERALIGLKPIWDRRLSYEISYMLVEGIARRLAGAGVKLTFDDEYLADDVLLNFQLKQNLENVGYKIVSPVFARLGMKKVSEKHKELQSHYKLEPTETEKEKIKILKEAAELFEREPRDIWIYSHKDEKNISEGQHDIDFEWVSRETLTKSFGAALSTYLHEIDHKHGDDNSKDFSLALTKTLEVVIDELTSDLAISCGELRKKWDELNK